jgi:hypothetical protein
MLALSLQSLSLNAGMAPAARVQRMQAPVMVKSQALPFLEAPAKLDGSMAGDRVRIVLEPAPAIPCVHISG